ncbi:unnamed protein product, partial [Agarophyton chilense]
ARLVAAASLAARGSGGRSSVSGVSATVFGATGFLGRYVVNHLGRIGSQLTVPFRGDELLARHLKPMGDLGQIVPLPFELRDHDSLRQAIRGSSVVVNLIGKNYATANYSFEHVHVRAVETLASIAREERVSHFVHVSTAPPQQACTSQWLRTKNQGEVVLRDLFPHATIVRPADMFGAEDRLLTRLATNVVSAPIIALPRDGESRVQPVWVNDVASVIAAAVRDPDRYAATTLELGGPQVLTVRDLYDFVCTSTKREARFFPLPPRVMHFGMRLTAMRLPFVNPDPSYTTDQLSVECAERVVDDSKQGVLRFEHLHAQPMSIQSDLGHEILRRFRRGGDRSSLFYVD